MGSRPAHLRAVGDALDGLDRLARRRHAEQEAGAHDVPAEEPVELGAEIGREVVAVPPEPVRRLRRVEVLPRLLEPVRVDRARALRCRERLAGPAERGPGVARSSACPIQMRYEASIQDPEWMRVTIPPCGSAVASDIVTVSTASLAASAPYSRSRNSWPLCG